MYSCWMANLDWIDSALGPLLPPRAATWSTRSSNVSCSTNVFPLLWSAVPTSVFDGRVFVTLSATYSSLLGPLGPPPAYSTKQLLFCVRLQKRWTSCALGRLLDYSVEFRFRNSCAGCMGPAPRSNQCRFNIVLGFSFGLLAGRKHRSGAGPCYMLPTPRRSLDCVGM